MVVKRLGRLMTLFLVIGLISAVTACGGDDDEGSGGSSSGTLRVVAVTEPSNLNWYEAALESYEITFGGVYEPLVGRDPKTLEPAARLATEWKQIDPTHWQFKLREGVKFHDGSTFDSADVVATVTHAVESESLILGYVPLEKAEAPDAYTVDIYLSSFSPTFLQLQNWLYILPSELAQEATRTNDEAIGTGPYRLATWERGTSMTLEAFEDYWGPEPPTDKVVISYRKEAAIRLSALKAGEADFVFDLLPEQVNEAPKTYSVPATELWVLYPNSSAGDDPIFGSLEMRKALASAIDRESLVKNLFGGKGTVFEGLQPALEFYFGYNDDLDEVKFDKDAAKKILDSEGAGQREVHYVGTAGRWPKDRELAEALTGMLTAAGFKVRLEIPDLDTYVKYILQTDDENRAIVSDLITVAAGSGYLGVERIVSTYLSSKGAVSVVNDPKLDSMIEDAQKENNVEAREQKYRDIIKYSADEFYAIWLFAPDFVYGTSKDVDWPAPTDTRVYPQEIRIK